MLTVRKLMNNYLYADNSDLDQVPSIRELVDYYNKHVERVAEILGSSKSDIPVQVLLGLMRCPDARQLGSRYIKGQKKIEYEYRVEENILEDNGRLIHEAAHVVQDYLEDITQGHPCWWLMEGIADYCRGQIDEEFNLEQDLEGKPLEKGYKDAAHFLLWLSKKYTKSYPNVIPRLNRHIQSGANSVLNEIQILDKITEGNACALLREYHEENKDKFVESKTP